MEVGARAAEPPERCACVYKDEECFRGCTRASRHTGVCRSCVYVRDPPAQFVSWLYVIGM